MGLRETRLERLPVQRQWRMNIMMYIMIIILRPIGSQSAKRQVHAGSARRLQHTFPFFNVCVRVQVSPRRAKLVAERVVEPEPDPLAELVCSRVHARTDEQKCILLTIDTLLSVVAAMCWSLVFYESPLLRQACVYVSVLRVLDTCLECKQSGRHARNMHTANHTRDFQFRARSCTR